MIPALVIANQIFLANKPTPDPIIQHLQKNIYPVAFFVGQLVLPKENYPGNLVKYDTLALKSFLMVVAK